MQRVNHVLNQLNKHYSDSNVELTKNEIFAANNSDIIHKFYNCTLDAFSNNVLTKSQRDFYEENGYLIIRNLLNTKECNILINRFNELITNPSIRGPEIQVMKDIAYKNINKLKDKTIVNEINKIQNVAYDPIYHKHFENNPKITKYTKAFIGNSLRTLDHIHIQKPPDLGYLSSRHPLHQDQLYFGLTNINRIVGVWTALETVNRNNGGFCVVPGSHKPNILYTHQLPKQSFSKLNTNYGYLAVTQSVFDAVKRYRLHLDMKAGDTIFFHPLLIHGSSANLSKDKTRHSYVTHYVNSEKVDFGNYLDKNKNIFQEQKRKREVDVDSNKVWKIISRQITGNVGYWTLSDKEIELIEKVFFKRKMNSLNWKNTK
eukprot:305072_1